MIILVCDSEKTGPKRNWGRDGAGGYQHRR